MKLNKKDYILTKEQYDLGKKIYLSYVYALTFLPGNLSIFYGDEIGMQGMGNLANRRPFTWNNIDNELLEFFKGIGSIRKKEKFLESADLEIIDINGDYFVFKRVGEYEEVLVYVSRANYDVGVALPNDYKDESVLYTLSDSNKEKLGSYGGMVLKKRR